MTSSRHAITRVVRRLAAVSLASLALAGTASAQHHLAPAGVTTVAAPPAALTAEARAERHTDRAGRVFDYTLNGMLIGAGVGLAFAIILSTSSDGHGEGVPVGLFAPVVGGVLGTVVGTVVGIIRTQ